jgi:hypothetical protein
MATRKKKKNRFISFLKKFKLGICIQLFSKDKKKGWIVIHTPYWIPYLEFASDKKEGWWRFSISVFGITPYILYTYKEDKTTKKRKVKK